MRVPVYKSGGVKRGWCWLSSSQNKKGKKGKENGGN